MNSTTDPNRFIRRLSQTNIDLKKQQSINSISTKSISDKIDIGNVDSSPNNNPQVKQKQTILTINISGERYQTYLSTLQTFPETLLSKDEKREFYWNEDNQEYFFDRHRHCFPAILYYYQSKGRLRRPEYVPLDTFLEEVKFFQLGSEAIKQVQKQENLKEVKPTVMPEKLWRRYIWFYISFPQHSILGRIISIASIVLTLLSCLTMAIESLPVFQERWESHCQRPVNSTNNQTDLSSCPNIFESPFFIVQTISIGFFTIEYILRLISTPSYRKFFTSFFDWIDFSVIVSYYVLIILYSVGSDRIGNTTADYIIRILRVLRFLRVLRLYIIFERMKSLRVLITTIKESIFDLLMMFTILTLLAFIFGSAVYFAEKKAQGDLFDSIPLSLYWGIITITGVGYGDITPKSPVGRILTCFCALIGPAMVGMLVSALVDRYQRVYTRKIYIPDPDIDSVDLELLKKTSIKSKLVLALPKVILRQDSQENQSKTPSSLMFRYRSPQLKRKQSIDKLDDLNRQEFKISLSNDSRNVKQENENNLSVTEDEIF